MRKYLIHYCCVLFLIMGFVMDDSTYFFLALGCFFAIHIEKILEAKREEEYQEMYDMFDKITHRISEEKHQEIYYWFDKDNEEFLAQGATTEEIINKLKIRFPQHMFFIEDSEEDKVYIIRAPDWKIMLHRETT